MKAPFSRIAYAVAFFLVATYAAMTLYGPHGLRALLDKQAQIRDLEQQNAHLAHDVERMREHIQRLSLNPEQQELEIRDKLKLIKPGEKVFITGEPDAAPAGR